MYDRGCLYEVHRFSAPGPGWGRGGLRSIINMTAILYLGHEGGAEETNRNADPSRGTAPGLKKQLTGHSALAGGGGEDNEDRDDLEDFELRVKDTWWFQVIQGYRASSELTDEQMELLKGHVNVHIASFPLMTSARRVPSGFAQHNRHLGIEELLIELEVDCRGIVLLELSIDPVVVLGRESVDDRTFLSR